MEDDREMRDGEAMITDTGNGDRCGSLCFEKRDLELMRFGG